MKPTTYRRLVETALVVATVALLLVPVVWIVEYWLR